LIIYVGQKVIKAYIFAIFID